MEETALGPMRKGRDGICRGQLDGDLLLWIPPEAKYLRVRLMTSARMTLRGNRSGGATPKHLNTSCVWPGIEEDVRQFVRTYLHCAESRVGFIITQLLESV